MPRRAASSSPVLPADGRSCPSDGPSNRCRRRTPADRRPRQSSDDGSRRRDDDRQIRIERLEASAIRAAIASTDRARACRARRSPTSGCSTEGVGVVARHGRAACRAASARPRAATPGSRSMWRRDVPAQTEHGLARVEQGLPDQPEVVGSILNAIETGRALDAPAVFSRLDNPLLARCRCRVQHGAVPIIRPASIVGTCG